MYETEDIFKILNRPKYNKVIQDVYAPVHIDDGRSLVKWRYEYNYSEYMNLLQRIIEIKPVRITYPFPDLNVMKRYIGIGVKDFIISEVDEDILSLAKDNEVNLHRSIVNNYENVTIDKRFKSIIVPYTRMLDLSWIQHASCEIDLIVIPNHYCRAKCSEHPTQALSRSERSDKQILTEDNGIEMACFHVECIMNYDDPSLFLPRQVVQKLNWHVSTFQLKDRGIKPYYYLDCIDYYAYCDDNALDRMHWKCRDKHNRFYDSQLFNGNCRFECDNCTIRCFGR